MNDSFIPMDDIKWHNTRKKERSSNEKIGWKMGITYQNQANIGTL